MNPSINERNRLSDYPQILVLIVEILDLATAAGMSEKEAELVYGLILRSFSKVPGNAFPILRDHIFCILSASDQFYASAEESISHSYEWRN